MRHASMRPPSLRPPSLRLAARLAPGLASVLVLFGPVPGTTQTIRVEERAGIARASEPVTLGMPFARGILPASTPLRIIDGAVPVDAQFRPVATWDDGSIKWLKCGFQATVGANAMRDYALELGVSHTPSTELDVAVHLPFVERVRFFDIHGEEGRPVAIAPVHLGQALDRARAGGGDRDRGSRTRPHTRATARV